MGGNNNYSHRRAERDAHQRVWGEIQLIGGARQFKAPIGNTPEERIHPASRPTEQFRHAYSRSGGVGGGVISAPPLSVESFRADDPIAGFSGSPQSPVLVSFHTSASCCTTVTQIRVFFFFFFSPPNFIFSCRLEIRKGIETSGVGWQPSSLRRPSSAKVL